MADAIIHAFPRERRDVPHNLWADVIVARNGGEVAVLRPDPQPDPRYWAKPVRSPEMELLLALIAVMQARPGFKRLGTDLIHTLHPAMAARPRDPSLYTAINELCSGAYR